MQCPLLPLGLLLVIGSVVSSPAAPVTNWVTTNGNAGFVGASAGGNSPVTTDADAETIVGSFPSVTLTDGLALTLTGQVKITGNSGGIPGNQFRWGLFEAPGTPSPGIGAGYVGI